MIPFGRRLQDVHRMAGEYRCAVCNVAKESHFRRDIEHDFQYKKEEDHLVPST